MMVRESRILSNVFMKIYVGWNICVCWLEHTHMLATTYRNPI